MLFRSFEGYSTSIYLNDSLLMDSLLTADPCTLSINRFSEQSALMIVDNATERISLFELSERGGTYRFEKEDDRMMQLPQ